MTKQKYKQQDDRQYGRPDKEKHAPLIGPAGKKTKSASRIPNVSQVKDTRNQYQPLAIVEVRQNCVFSNLIERKGRQEGDEEPLASLCHLTTLSWPRLLRQICDSTDGGLPVVIFEFWGGWLARDGSVRRKARWPRSLWVLLVVFATLVAGALLLTWDPQPVTQTSFDRRENGLWLGHRWFTGFGVRDGLPVKPESIEDLTRNFSTQGIRYAFVHVGPVEADGTIKDSPGPLLGAMMIHNPEIVWLAWLGARVERIPLESPAFQAELIRTVQSLQAAGFAGVHFDFEPLSDQHPGYLDTLEAVRSGLGANFLISQATPRAGPFGFSFGPLRDSFWSEEFYRATMERTDQTVVMAYDTGLDFTKGYVAFVKHQTARVGQWACDEEDHQILIGLPSYEDVPIYSDPQVENLRTASLGVRAALEEEPLKECFQGVAIYAYWVTDESEWQTFGESWIDPGIAFQPQLKSEN